MKTVRDKDLWATEKKTKKKSWRSKEQDTWNTKRGILWVNETDNEVYKQKTRGHTQLSTYYTAFGKLYQWPFLHAGVLLGTKTFNTMTLIIMIQSDDTQHFYIHHNGPYVKHHI